MRRHYVYRHYSATGELLYIGCTCWVPRVFRKAPWVSAIQRVTVDYYDSREEALKVESRAITEEMPRFNLMRSDETVEQVLARLPQVVFTPFTIPPAISPPIPRKKLRPPGAYSTEVAQALAALPPVGSRESQLG